MDVVPTPQTESNIQEVKRGKEIVGGLILVAFVIGIFFFVYKGSQKNNGPSAIVPGIQIIGTIPDNVDLDNVELFFDPAGKRAAYVVREGDLDTGFRDYIVIDNKKSIVYDDINYGDDLFSPDGSISLYTGSNYDNEYETAYENSKKIGRYYSVDGISYSLDGRHYAFAAEKVTYIPFLEDDIASEYIIFDGHSIGPFYNAEDPGFRPSDNALVYIIGSDYDGERIVIDGNAGKWYGAINNYLFSPDGSRILYIARESELYDSKKLIIVDGEEFGSFDDITHYVFSPDSKHVTYVAHEGDIKHLYIDDKLIRTAEGITYGLFNEDGSVYAYSYWNGDKQYVVRGNEFESEPFDKMGGISIQLSPDGSKVAFMIRQDEEIFIYENERLVSQERVIFEYDSDGELVFQKSDLTGVVKIKDGRETVLMSLGQDESPYYWGQAGEHFLAFIRDRNSLKTYAIINNKKMQLFDEIAVYNDFGVTEEVWHDMHFGENSDQFRYVALNGRDILFVVESL